jgi:hypothetical protein
MATSQRKYIADAGTASRPDGRAPMGMSERASAYRIRPTTQAAEGVPRFRWTLAEFERLGELGILAEEDRIELIEGELVPMSPKGNHHEVVRGAILNWLRRNLADEYDLHVEPGWRAAGSHCELDLSGRQAATPHPCAAGCCPADRGSALEPEARHHDEGRPLCTRGRA